jgi:hypothetical protein
VGIEVFCDFFAHYPSLQHFLEKTKFLNLKGEGKNGTGPVINTAVQHMFSMHVGCYLSFYSPNPPSSQIYNADFSEVH